MKVKIIKCSDEKYWYKNSISQIFDADNDPDFEGLYQVYYRGYPSNLFCEKTDCEVVLEPTEKKIYFKIYQDIENIHGGSYISTPEEFIANFKDLMQPAIECGDELFPVVELVRMTEEEVNALPEFTGY
jgi:hypothetical protein